MKKFQRSNGLRKESSYRHYLFKMIFVFIWVCITGCSFVQNTATQTEEEPESYIETFLGDERTPLVLLKREILSSEDVLSCSEHQNSQSQNTIRQESSPLLEEATPHQQVSVDYKEGSLLGIPLTALHKQLNIIGVVTDFPEKQPVYQTPIYQDIFRKYHLMGRRQGVQAELIKSSDGHCFLGFAVCSHQDNCITDDDGQSLYYIQIPVLGISQNHQTVIIDPVLMGDYLKDKVMTIRSRYTNSTLKVKDPQSRIAGFSQSTLVFDIISTLDLPNLSPLPKMTTRWFMKFGLDRNTENFVPKAPTEGVEYITTHSALKDAPLILLRNISKDNPVHFYIKNVPNEYQEPFREGFEYWNAIFISLVGYPALTYKFIQGDYDGAKEIIAGDMRYNILEWDLKYRHTYNGYSLSFYDENTGEIWGTSTLIQGPRLVEEYSRWFRYSEIIRSNEVIREPPLTTPFYASTYNLISQVFIDGFPPHHQPLMLAPENETFESYMLGLLRKASIHEIGHTLGLDHEHESSTFAQNGYAGHSAMDYEDVYNASKPVSGYYDEMALAYGYLGRLPERTDISCSTNDLINFYNVNGQKDKSPECSRADGTNFPLENFAVRLGQTRDLLISRKDDQSFPYLIWNDLVARYVSNLTFGLISYHFSAETHYDQLRTVLIEGRKPENAQEVKDLVMEHLQSVICDPEFQNTLRAHSLDLSDPFDNMLHQNTFNFLGVVNGTVFRMTDITTIECL